MKKHTSSKIKELENFEISFDLEKEWNVISQRLDQKKKRTGIIYYILPLGICSLIAIIFIYSNYFMTSVGRAEIYSSRSESASIINSPELSVQVTQSPTQTDVQNEKETGIITATLSNTEMSKNDISTSMDRIIQSSGKKDTKYKKEEAEFSGGTSDKETNTSPIARLKDSDERGFSDLIINKRETDITSDQKLTNISVLPNDEKVLHEIMPNNVRLINLDFLPTIQYLVEGKNQISYADSRVVPAKKHNIFPWFLGLNFGVGIPTASYENGRNESSLYKDWRKSTESPLESLHAGMMIGKFINKNLYLNTGIQWHRINEQFNYSNELVKINILTDQPTSIYENFRGDLDIEFGEIEKRTTTNIQKRKYNNFQSWAVPLKIGYMLPLGSFAIGIESGLIYQFSVQYEGEIIQPDLYVSEINNVMTMRSNNFWMENSVGLYKTIGKDYVIGLQTSMRNTLRAINHNQDDISQQFRDTNLRFNILKRL